jgi:hypothetical protein
MIVYLAYAVALVLPTAFVSYWLGVGHAEARLRGLVRDLREHRAQLRDQVEGLAAEVARAADPVRLTAAEVDAWHELVAHEDEAA